MASIYSIYFCENVFDYENVLDVTRSQNVVFWHPSYENLKIISAKLKMEINKAGSLTIQIPYNHPYISKIHKKRTRFYVKRNADVIWCGRVLDTKRTFYKSVTITAEGSLTYLIDTIQRPYDYDDVFEAYKKYTGNISPGSVPKCFLLKYLIDRHNKECDYDKTFTLNIIYQNKNYSIDEALRNIDLIGKDNKIDETLKKRFKEENYNTTISEISDEILSDVSGFIFTTFDVKNNKNILNYCLNETGIINKNISPIEFGKNLIDFDETVTSDGIYTQCIPLGVSYSDIESLRKKAYDTVRKVYNKTVTDDKLKMPNWEDSGYSMPKSVNKNRKITINTKVNLFYLSEWSATVNTSARDYVNDDTVSTIDGKTDIQRYGKTTVSMEIDAPLPKELPLADTETATIEKQCKDIYSNYIAKLKEKALKQIKKNHSLNCVTKVKAFDLANINNGIDYIDCGYSVPVISKPHGLDSSSPTIDGTVKKGMNLLCSSVDINLVSPGESEYTIGADVNALSDKSFSNKKRSGKAYGLAKSSYTI